MPHTKSTTPTRTHTAEPRHPAPLIPDHEMIHPIGGGSYGEVWLARSLTGSYRAIKVVWRDDFELERTFEREFEGIKKFEPISRSHPGLVHILHVGRNDEQGFYYYVMELADGQGELAEVDPDLYVPNTLRMEMNFHGRVPIKKTLDFGVSIAEALAHLHSHGLAHRDIKPSNIIFVGGGAKLADIGLVAESGQRTFVGTEGFVPPEGPGSTRADIYSLGMVLYEMATGKDRLEFPELPSHVPGSKKDRERWRELNTVICKACAPNPRKRFRSAAEFAEALRAVRGGIKPKPLLAPLLRLPALSAMAAAIIVLARSPSEGTAAAAAANALAAEIGKVEAAANSEPDDPRGSLRIESKPSGVDVVIGGMTLDVTPCLVGDLLPGDVTLLFRKTGYRDAEQTVEVEAGKETPMMVTLERWRQPIPGRYWENSLGMKFRPEDRHHIAIEPVEYDGKFESYINAMTDPFFVGGFLDHRDANGNLLSLAAVPKEDADQFCEWLTERDRTEGYISPDHFYTWEKVDGLPGQESLDSGEENPLVIFRACLKKREYGNVWITSVPDGAEVWFKGESVGMTPLDLPKVLVGPADFEVRKSGYRTAKVSGEVQAGKELPFDVTLEPSGEVIFGETWDSNSLGVPYVPVRDIMVAAYETRVSDMAAFAAESKREIPPPPFEQGGDHPAVGVTRSEAIAFCDWLTQKERAAGLIPADVAYRLPSDLEWSALVNLPPERPGAPADRQILIKNAYPWGRGLWPPPGGSGNFFDATAAATLKQPAERSLGQYGYDDGHAFTSPVGRSQPNAFGIHDLGGNAWEWVSDDFGGANKKFQTFGVLRGASHASWEQETLLSSFRNAADPEARTDGGQFGFRCVLAKVAPTPAANPADAASEGGGEVSEKATP